MSWPLLDLETFEYLVIRKQRKRKQPVKIPVETIVYI